MKVARRRVATRRSAWVVRTQSKYSFELSQLWLCGLPEQVSSSALVMQCARGPKVSATEEAELGEAKLAEGPNDHACNRPASFVCLPFYLPLPFSCSLGGLLRAELRPRPRKAIMAAPLRWSHHRDGPLFYSHIPRTAGSELSLLLRAMLPAQAGLSKGQKSSPLDCWQQSPAPLVVYGHTMPPDPGFKCGPKPGGPRYAVATMVREPLAHLISRSKQADDVCDWLRVHRPTDDLGQPTVLPSRCGMCEHVDHDGGHGGVDEEDEDAGDAGCSVRAARQLRRRLRSRLSQRQQCELRRNQTRPRLWSLRGVVDERTLAASILARADEQYQGRNQLDWVGSGYPGAATGQAGCLGLREGCASPTCNGFNRRPAATSERLCPAAERLRRANASLDAMAWVGLTEQLAPSLCLLRKTLLDGVGAETRARFVPPPVGGGGGGDGGGGGGVAGLAVDGGGGGGGAAVMGWWRCGCMKTCRDPFVPPPPPPPPSPPPCLIDPATAAGGGAGGRRRRKRARAKAPRVRGECERPGNGGSYHGACCDGGARLDASIRRSASNGLSRLLRERFGASVWPPLAAHLAGEMAMYAHAVKLHAQRVREAGC